MKMHVLSGGRLEMRKSVYYPGAPREEMFSLPVSCVLIKHPQGKVLLTYTSMDPDGHVGAAMMAVQEWKAGAKP